jgi:hypothetical protein
MDTQTTFRMDLVDDAIAANQAPEDAEYLTRLVAYKEKIMSEIRISPTGVYYEDGTTDEFAGHGDGNGHTNKSETPASDAQKRFIGNLLNDRIVPEGGGLHAGAINLFNADTISKRSATDLIEWLTNLPIKAEKKNTASEKQVNFIEKLIGQLNDDTRPAMQAFYEGVVERGELTGKSASGMIDGLLKQVNSQPKQATPPRPAADEVTEGMYRKDGEIYKVQRAIHGSGQLYAKKLVGSKNAGWGFEYAAGAIRKLTTADKMTLEEAKEWGALYGTCCVCGRTLTDENSIAEGIGPICASKF